MRTTNFLLLVSLLGLTACQGGPGSSEPIIDRQGVDMEAYRADLAECRNYADEVAVAERTSTGAAAGAVVTGAIGAILGDSDSAARGAGAGAVAGGARGAASAGREQREVLRNCLRGRGYRVLN